MLLPIYQGTSKPRKYGAVNDSDFVGSYAPKPRPTQSQAINAGHNVKPVINWNDEPVFTPSFTSTPKRKRSKPTPQYPKHRWSN